MFDLSNVTRAHETICSQHQGSNSVGISYEYKLLELDCVSKSFGTQVSVLVRKIPSTLIVLQLVYLSEMIMAIGVLFMEF